MGQQHPMHGSRALAVEIEAESLALFELNRAVREGADAQLRSLKVQQDADRPSALAFHLADDRQATLVILVRSVAEVQPEHVRTRLNCLLYTSPSPRDS